MEKRPFEPAGDGPVRAFRDHYAAPFVGVSYDLAPHCVGLHPSYVEKLPTLDGLRVTISRDRAPRTPLHRRPAFQIVTLRRAMRNALDVAEPGGVVFSSFDLEDPEAAPLLEDLRLGEVVYLNAALSRLPAATIRRPFQDEPADASAS